MSPAIRTIEFPRPQVPDGISFRRGQPADMPAVRGLIEGVSYMSKRGLDHPDRFVVAVDAAGDIVGAAQGKPRGEAIEWGSRIVREDMRGTGIGDRLIWERARMNAGPILDAHDGEFYIRTRPQWSHAYDDLGFEHVGVRDAPLGMLQATALAGMFGVPAEVLRIPKDVRILLEPEPPRAPAPTAG